ncbi:MAG: cell wall binding protein [Caloramator sp.]|jgi:putative cell wall-binding protein|uniref:cell wall-binding repeat-containing protein n=1 Tax=Caloramator sp. TaxID=1871330 RepID=UPI001D97E9D5|nr:cell wall-binding repeat-containing protein [Caloramator sp.]MBZ4664130.1 cell wall binding protein [Caloramator sp.]
MISKQKLFKKLTAWFISFLMLFNILGLNIQGYAAQTEIVAAWDYTSAPTSYPIPATSGVLKDSAFLSHFRSDNIIPKYSSGSLSINGWDNGANTKYWQIQLSTKGYENLTLSAKTRSSSTGPKNFKVIYSIDNGATWNDVPNSDYAITGTTLSYYMPTLLLPQDASNVENLIIRFIMTSNATSSSTTVTEVAPTGTSNINNIVVSGTLVVDEETVAPVTATPESGSEVALNSKVALSCETEGATIMYSINDGEFIQYDQQNKITLTQLPITIKAYAVKEGMKNSITSTFTYTQGKVASVTASPNGGAVLPFKKVTLSCETPNSIIKYSLDNGETWNTYEAPITLTNLPVTIKAYATAEGLLDSPISTFNFTKKINSEYNIYFGQIHSHTTNSDGLGSLDDAYTYAKNTAKLDFFAVTDHSNSFDNANISSMADGSKSTKWLNGHSAADRYTDSNFVGIYAFEMTWSNGTGHINTFNTPGFETRDTAKYKLPDGLKQYYNVLKLFPDSISQFNHPGPTFGDFNDFAYYDPQIDKLITLIEVGNGEGPIRSSGYFPSYEYYTRALDKGWHLAPTNNQDNHLGNWGTANTGRTVVLADSLTRENIYDAMRNMRVYATEDNNLRIKYTLNGEIMGTILDSKPESVYIKVDIEDPDNEPLGKISVIANGGKIVETKTVTTNKDVVEFNLSPNYSYYYIRVDQVDKDIAVTAPVWIGEVDKAGISKTTASTTLPLKGESFKITTNYFNNENVPMEITSLVYSINGKVIKEVPQLETVNPLSTGSYSFDYIPVSAGKFNIDVKMTAKINGVEKIFTDVLKIEVADPAITTKIVVDATHYNDYVYGYYANNLNNFITIANSRKIAVNVEKNKLTDEVLKDAQLLVITAPAKKAGTVNSIPYQPQSFSDEDLQVIKRFVDKGGNLIICGIADYQDGIGQYQTSTQMNRLLEAIGATTRFNNDEVVDDVNKVNNQNYRLAFNNYNFESPYLSGVSPEQKYSFYSGCSLNIDSEALATGKTTWLVKGYDTTRSIDSNKNLPGVSLPEGSVYALAVEKLPGGGNMFIGGTVFISDFEIKVQLDNSTQLQNSNYNITLNILDSIKKVIPVSKINTVRSGNKGDIFCVEGIVTAGKTPSDNSFFDTLYIQDETGGINLFPISSSDIMVGQRVKAVGTLDEYQGDLELRVIEYEVTDTNINPIEPTLLSTKDAMDSKNGGLLVKVIGTVTRMDAQNIYVDDGSGEARIFVDGYIGDGSGDESKKGKWDERITVGSRISAVGLASVDPNGPRLRVRNVSEIVFLEPAKISVSGISLNTTSKIINIGESINLIATVEPSNASNKDVVWESSNEGIAKVDASGKVTAVSEGEAKIKVRTLDGNYEAQCTIYVIKQNANGLSIRYAGVNRYLTSVEVSKKGFNRADIVIIASGENYSDALCAVPLSKKYNAPILLVSRNKIANEVVEEIKRLEAKQAFIVGGNAVVSDEVKMELEKIGVDVTRISGKDRYETSYEVAKLLNFDKAVIVSREGFADALSISSIAAKNGWPILFTKKNQLPEQIKELINTSKPEEVYVIGGVAVISDDVINNIENAVRIAGKDRYETNLEIAKKFNNEINYERIFVATGKNFPDGLFAGTLAAMTNSFVFLTGDGVSESIKNHIIENRLDNTIVFVVGGYKVVTEEIIKEFF